MVQLSLFFPKANQASRYFPYHGYLGLTPIKVEGVVRTKIDEDGKLLPAKSITVSVRCYESRLGRVNAMATKVLVDYTQVLWSKSDEREWDDIGDMEYPFRITVPTKVAGHSTAHFQDYRVWWRVEACVTHLPVAGVGSRILKHFELPFIRYDLPHPPSPSSPISYLASQTIKPRAPTVRYRLSMPTTPVGPQDLVSIPISLQPNDPRVSIRSAGLIIERRIQLHETIASPSNLLPPTLPITITPSSPSHPQSRSAPSSYSSTHENAYNAITDGNHLSPYSSPASADPSPSTSTVWNDEATRPLLSHSSSGLSSFPATHIPSKTITQSIAGVESSGSFSGDENGVWTKTLTLQWPSSKSQTRWAMGETMQTELASVKFIVRLKIIVSSPSGTESIDLEEQELTVVSTNEAERQLALSKYNELLCASYNTTHRSKSKSPRRTRREREALPSPPQSPQDVVLDIPVTPPLPKSADDSRAHGHTNRMSTPYGTKPKKKSHRRPHTSAGPSDMSNGFRVQPSPFERLKLEEGSVSNPEEAAVDDVPMGVITDSSGDDGIPATPPSSFGWKRIVAPALSVTTGFQIGSPRGRDNVNDDRKLFDPRVDQPQARGWEDDLTRIELQSRRSSKDIFSIFKRKRVHVTRDG